MGTKVILCVIGGNVVPKPLSKPQAPRKLEQWLRAAQSKATAWGVQCYAFKYAGAWRVFDTRQPPRPPKIFSATAPQEAVEMYLLAKEASNG